MKQSGMDSHNSFFIVFFILLNVMFSASAESTTETVVNSEFPLTLDNIQMSGGDLRSYGKFNISYIQWGKISSYHFNDGSDFDTTSATRTGCYIKVGEIRVSDGKMYLPLNNLSDDMLISCYDTFEKEGKAYYYSLSLNHMGPYVLEASIGSPGATLRGLAKVAYIAKGNKYEYTNTVYNIQPSVQEGSVVSFEVKYELLGGKVWSPEIFEEEKVAYRVESYIDFSKAVSTPWPKQVEIFGPDEVDVFQSSPYRMVVHYADGSLKNITSDTAWKIEPEGCAWIDPNSVLHIERNNITNPLDLILHGEYLENGTLLTTTKKIKVHPNPLPKVQEWTCFRGNKEHTGYTPLHINPDLFYLRWQKEVAKSINLGSPCIAEDLVFVCYYDFASHVSGLHALDLLDGSVVWKYDFEGAPVRYFNLSYDNNLLYVSMNGWHTSGKYIPSYLYSFNRKTGDIYFQVKSEAYQTVPFNGKLYYSTHPDRSYGFYCMDALDTSQNYYRATREQSAVPPTVTEDAIYTIEADTLIATNLQTLENQYFKLPTDKIYGGNSVAVPGSMNNLVFTLDNGYLVNFNLETQETNWLLKDRFIDQPTAIDGIVYAVMYESLEAIDEMTGQRLWSWNHDDERIINPFIATDTHIILSTVEEKTYAIDRITGYEAWSYPASGYLAFADETLFIAQPDGILTAIATPVFIPSKPVCVEIKGVDVLEENSQSKYRLIVEYENGVKIERTNLAAWDCTPQTIATIDQMGNLITSQLVNPLETVAVHATYSEQDVTLEASKNIELEYPGTIEELINRNLSNGMEFKEAAHSLLAETLNHEQFSIQYLCDKFSSGSKGYQRGSVRSTTSLLISAFQKEIMAQLLILKSMDVCFLPVYPYCESNENFEIFPGKRIKPKCKKQNN